MSNIQAATKVADQLISRLFDHRQFTGGEINFLIREFGGEKGTNIEDTLDRILKISENVCLISDSSTDDKLQSSAKTIEHVGIQMNSLYEKAERTLKIEEKQREKEAKMLSEIRDQREKTKQDAYEKRIINLEKLKETLMEEEMEIERKYLMFEENLRQSSN